MLFLDYRPQTWQDFKGNEKALQVAKINAEKHLQSGKPLAIWLDGPSGTGKTTLAWIIARQLGAASISIEEWDGGAFDQKRARQLENEISYSGMGGNGWRVFIVNEAHSLTTGAVNSLLTLLERMPAKRAIIFTTTEGRKATLFGNLDAPLKSRCLELSLTNQGLAEDFAALALEIAEKEGLGGATLAQAKRLVQDNKNNMRRVLSAIQAGALFQAPILQANQEAQAEKASA